MITSADILVIIMFIKADVVCTNVDIRISSLPSVLTRPFEKTRRIGVPSVFLFNVNSAYPGPKIHTAHKIVGNQASAADNPITFEQKIPTRQW